MLTILQTIYFSAAKQAPALLDPAKDLFKPIDLSDPTKIVPEISSLREKITDLVLIHGPKILMGVLVMVVGFWLINHGKKWMNQILIRRGFNVALSQYAINLVSIIFKMILTISFFSTIGIETTSFVAVLGAASLAIGLALQGNLANFAGGVVLLLFKPFKTGENIIFKDIEGVVREIQIFHTIIITADGKKIVLPNGDLSNSIIQNTSAEQHRRTDFTFYLSPNANFELARNTIRDMIAHDERIDKTLRNIIAILEINALGAKLAVRIWCKSSEYLNVILEYPEKIKNRLDEVKIDWPTTQTEVRLIQADHQPKNNDQSQSHSMNRALAQNN